MNLFTLVAKLALDSEEYEKGLDQANEKAGGLGNALKTALGIGAGALTAATSAAAGLTSEFIKGVGNIASYGDNIDKMSQKMGLSAQAYQEWDAIMQHSGTSIESLQSGMKTLANAVESGNDAFKRLGISQKDIEKMNQEELFSATITALQNVSDETERTYLAGQLLGRGATELGALLNTSAEDTEAMRQRVHELGGVLSDEAVKGAAAYQDSLQDMQTAITGLKNGVMADFLPAVTSVMNGLTEIFAGDSEQGIGMIKEGITNVGDGIRESIPNILSTAGEIATSLLGLLTDSLPGFLDMGFQVIGSLISGISSNLPQILSAIVSMAGSMLSSLVSRLPEFIAMGIQLIGSIISGLVQAIPDILTQIGKIVSDMVSSFLDYDWLSLGKSIIDGIVAGIRNFGGSIASTLKDMASNAFNGIKNFFGINSPSKLMRDQIGRWIPEGIAVGITANADSVADAMEDLSSTATYAFGTPKFDVKPSYDPAPTDSLLDEIRSLKEAVLGMQIVLDSGTLVGELTPAFDTALGSRAVYSGRGN